jgi:hypothetical protein
MSNINMVYIDYRLYFDHLLDFVLLVMVVLVGRLIPQHLGQDYHRVYFGKFF